MDYLKGCLRSPLDEMYDICDRNQNRRIGLVHERVSAIKSELEQSHASDPLRKGKLDLQRA